MPQHHVKRGSGRRWKMIWGKKTNEKLWMYRRHRWFAWRPVRLEDGRWIWLEVVIREKESHPFDRWRINTLDRYEVTR